MTQISKVVSSSIMLNNDKISFLKETGSTDHRTKSRRKLCEARLRGCGLHSTWLGETVWKEEMWAQWRGGVKVRDIKMWCPGASTFDTGFGVFSTLWLGSGTWHCMCVCDAFVSQLLRENIWTIGKLARPKSSAKNRKTRLLSKSRTVPSGWSVHLHRGPGWDSGC